MKKSKKLLISLFAAICVVCAALAFFACSGSGKSKSVYGVGEQGIYYFAENSDTEYLLSMQSGTYMITMGDTVTSTGTYSVNEGTGEVSFGDKGFSATLLGNKLSLNYNGGTYVFHLRVNYTVNFMVGDATVSQSVLNGKAAEQPDGTRDGYVFLGWYADEAYTTPYTFTEEISGDTVIYGRYEARDYTAAEYTVTYDFGDGVRETAKTQNGRIYSVLLPEISGSWWVSATNDADELTYRYDGEQLFEDTTLYAVYSEGLGVSVYDDRVTWDVLSTSTIITVMSGEEVIYTVGTSSLNAYAYDFSSLPAGKYTVVVSNSYGEEERTYVSHGLARVSGIEVINPRFLIYGAVKSAERYVICIESGDGTTYVDNKTNLVYDFSSYTMGAEGISFTIYALADGMYYSVSDTLVYFAGLDKPNVTSSGDTITWDEVKYAYSYEVYIDGELVATTTDTSYSAKYMNPGTCGVQVRPVLEGYYSEKSAVYNFVKNTLAAPEITGVDNGTIYWTEVDGASGYIVMVGGDTYSVTANSFATSEANIPDDAEGITVSVKALSENSSYSASSYGDAVYIAKSEMGSALTYENKTVYWQYSLAAARYMVQVNGEDEIEVVGKNWCEVTLTKYGENTITVYYYDEYRRKSSVAAITVFAYAVLLDARGGEIEGGADVIYLVPGDVMDLPETTLEYYEFTAWYTLPDLTNFESDADIYYSGTGTLLSPGTVFEGGENKIYYAFYTPDSYIVTLYVGNGYLLDESGNPVLDENGEYASTYEQTVYYGRIFTLPQVVETEYGSSFGGWYDERNGVGHLYVDEYGENVIVWNKQRDADLYAYYRTLLVFSVTTYNKETIATVSKGKNIDTVSEVTVPEVCEIDGVEYTVGYIGSTAFNSCSKLKIINIPDTIRYLATANNGYSSGSGAFANCANITDVNVYATGDEENTTREIMYYSEDGVLFKKNENSEGVSIVYYPKGRTGAYVIPETVSNENEYELVGQNFVKIERNVETLPGQVFGNNSSLTSVTIPATVKRVEIQAFYRATKLTKVVFEEANFEGATLEIYENAFQTCTALTSITLPSHLTSFDLSAFPETLVEIKIEREGGNYTSREGYLCNSTGTEIVFAPRGVTEFNIQDSAVIKIGDSAFEGCTKLKTVVINNHIQSIGKRAFYGCTEMTSLKFSGGADSSTLMIDEYAFYGCTALTSLTLPVNLTTIGAYAFGGCSGIKTVNVNSATANPAFADKAFADTSGTYYVTTVNIGSGTGTMNIASVFGPNVTTVNLASGNTYYALVDGVLYDSGYTQIVFYPYGKEEYTTPDSLKSISAYIFQGRTDLKKITISQYVETIEEGAFYGCANLTEVTFANVTAEDAATTLAIGASAFANCTSLESISMPERLVSMGDATFSGCTKLKNFTITKNLVTIGANDGDVDVRSVFAGCTSLEMVDVAQGNTSFVSDDGILYNIEKTQLYYASKNTGTSTNGTVTIASSVTRIWANAFSGNEGMTTLEFDSGIDFAALTLDDYAFADCENLTTVNLPEGLKSLSEGLFSGCTKISSITIPTSVESIAVNVFDGDTALAEIKFETRSGESPTPLTLADGTSSGGVFSGLSALKTASLPEGTTAVSSYAFYNCTALESLDIPSTVTTIGGYGVANCGTTAASGVKITFAAGSKLMKIESYAFSGATLAENNFETCDQLATIEANAFDKTYAEKLTFSSSMTSIGEKSMYNSKIEEVEMPGVTEIGKNAFYNSTIKSVTMGNIKEIGNWAFAYCEKLTDVTMTVNAQGLDVGMYAFMCCYSLTSLVFPEGTASLGEGCVSMEEWEWETKSALAYVELPSTIKSLGLSCFYGCISLKEVMFETDTNGFSSLEEVGGAAFACTGLESFSFPKCGTTENITYIELGDEIFEECEYLEYIYLSESVTDILPVIQNNYSQIKEIEVAEGSENFAVVEGVPILFDKNVTAIKFVFAAEDAETTLDLSDVDVYGEIETIGSYVFQATPFTKIILPSNLVTIDERAFMSNTSLEEIEIPSLQTMGTYVFYGCSNLEKVTFGEKATLTEIGARAFYSCTKLASVNLPASVVTLGDFAFYQCKALDGIDLSHVTSYGEAAFYQCTSLTEITFAEGLTELASRTSTTYGYFKGCTSLTTVNMSSTLTYIGGGAFYGCTALTSIDLTHVTTLQSASSNVAPFYNTGLTSVKIPAGMTGACSYAFGGCKSLVSVEFDSECVNGAMATYMFSQCTSLASVTLPNNANFTTIPNYAFNGCGLTELDLPENVTSIGTSSFQSNKFESVDLSHVTSFGSSAFQACNNLRSVILPNGITTELSAASKIFYNCALEEISLPDTMEAIPTYFLYGNANLASVTFPTGITEIPEYACYGCTSLGEVVFEGNVTSIAQYAFQGCASLAALGAIDVTSIGASAFAGCTALKEFDAPALDSIGAGCFSGCVALAEIDLSGVSTLVGSKTFENCTSLVFADLSSIVLLTSDNEYTFDGCTGLATAVLNDDFTYLPAYMFRNCSSLEDVNIPSSLVQIGGSYVFAGCSSLEYVTLPSGVTTLQTYMFQNCTSLKEVTIIGNIAVVPQYCFAGCTKLSTVNIPVTITSIDAYAFQGCEALETISLASNLSSIGNYAFDGCTSLENVIIPEATTSIGQYAFRNCTGLEELWIGSAVTSVGSNSLSGCVCDLYIVNTQSYIETAWGSTWISSTGFVGTVYYYYDAENVEYSEDGTAYAYGYWYVEGDALVIVEYFPDVYTAEDCYILYNGDLDEVVGMYVYVDWYEDYVSYEIIGCETEENGVYVVTVTAGENEVSYSVVLDVTTMTAAVTVTEEA